MRSSVAVVAIFMILACEPTALAQSPVGDAYGGEGSVLSEVNRGSGQAIASDGAVDATGAQEATAAAADPSLDGDALPFTGLDLLLLAAGGVVLIGASGVLRRLAATTPKP